MPWHRGIWWLRPRVNVYSLYVVELRDRLTINRSLNTIHGGLTVEET